VPRTAEAEIRNLRAELQRLRNLISAVQSNTNALRGAVSDHEARITALEP